MAQEKKERTKRSSNDPALITEKASALPLQEKVDLIKTLKAQVAAELGDREAQAAQAKKIAESL